MLRGAARELVKDPSVKLLGPDPLRRTPTAEFCRRQRRASRVAVKRSCSTSASSPASAHAERDPVPRGSGGPAPPRRGRSRSPSGRASRPRSPRARRRRRAHGHDLQRTARSAGMRRYGDQWRSSTTGPAITCRRCGGEVKRFVQGGRATFWCAVLPAAAAAKRANARSPDKSRQTPRATFH